MAMARRALPSSSPIPCPRLEAVQVDHEGLTLVPRMRFHLSFKRSDLSVKPIDEWQLRQSLLSFVRESFSPSVVDKDISIQKHKDTYKNKRDDAVASGMLYLWDVQSLRHLAGRDEDPETIFEMIEKSILHKLSALELNLSGLKLKCQAQKEETDDLKTMERSWHEGHINSSKEFPDTIVVKGIPSRWIAELRVSSKPSILVIHTIFSHFGTLRNVDVQESESGAFSCDIWVQFELFSGFYSALKALCGRSMVKEGSSFKANYEVSWDNTAYFSERNIRKRRFEKDRMEELRRKQVAMEARQAEIARRQAELSRMEKERMAQEQLEQLREEEKRRAAQQLERQRLAEEEQEQERQRKLQLERERQEEEEEEEEEEEDKQRREIQEAEDQQRSLRHEEEEQQRQSDQEEGEFVYGGQMQRLAEMIRLQSETQGQDQRIGRKKGEQKEDSSQYESDSQRKVQKIDRYREQEMEPSTDDNRKSDTDRIRHYSSESSGNSDSRWELNEEKMQRNSVIRSHDSPIRLKDRQREKEHERVDRHNEVKENENLYKERVPEWIEDKMRNRKKVNNHGDIQWRDLKRERHRLHEMEPSVDKRWRNGIDRAKQSHSSEISREIEAIEERHSEESPNSLVRDDNAADSCTTGERWILCGSYETHCTTMGVHRAGYPSKRIRSIIVSLGNS